MLGLDSIIDLNILNIKRSNKGFYKKQVKNNNGKRLIKC